MIRLDQPWRAEAGQPPQREARSGPRVDAPDYRGSGKLKGFCTLVTGGDTSLGRAVALLYAREGADVALAYLVSPEEADITRRCVEAEGTRCLLLKGDAGDEAWCRRAVQRTVAAFGRLDVLVNNPAGAPVQPAPALPATSAAASRAASSAASGPTPAAASTRASPALPRRHVPHSHINELAEGPDELEDPRWVPGGEMPVGAYLRMARSALPYLRKGACIINTGLAGGLEASTHALEQAAAVGAVQALTRSLAASLMARGVRVNAIVPGPVWLPMDADSPAALGPAPKRAAQPEELSPAYVFLAAPACAASISGLVLPIPGGMELPR